MPLRGIMACLIVVCHVSFKYSESHYGWPFTSFGAPIVSTFFFLSGYGLTVSAERKGEKYLNGFLRRSLNKLLPQFIIASVIWILISCVWMNGNFKEDLWGFVIFRPPLPYSWFIYVLIILYMVFFFVFQLLIKKNIKFKLAILFIAILGVVVSFRLLGFEPYWYLSIFAFNVGTTYGAYHNRLNAWISHQRFFTIGTLMVILAILILYGIRSFLLAIIPLGVVIPILIFGSGKRIKLLTFLGSISYEIYLSHGIIIPTIGLLNLLITLSFKHWHLAFR